MAEIALQIRVAALELWAFGKVVRDLNAREAPHLAVKPREKPTDQQVLEALDVLAVPAGVIKTFLSDFLQNVAGRARGSDLGNDLVFFARLNQLFAPLVAALGELTAKVDKAAVLCSWIKASARDHKAFLCWASRIDGLLATATPWLPAEIVRDAKEFAVLYRQML
jgi:hypothetical protein